MFCVRPNESDYDKEYWASNENDFSNRYLTKTPIVHNIK